MNKFEVMDSSFTRYISICLTFMWIIIIYLLFIMFWIDVIYLLILIILMY